MVDMVPSIQGSTRLKFRIATRGLIGLRNALLTATRGMGVINTIFLEYAPVSPDASHLRCTLKEGWKLCVGTLSANGSKRGTETLVLPQLTI